jgi:Xaa-Pro aminopeptidase
MKRKRPSHLQQFQKQLKSLNVSGYWVTHIPDLFYLAGFGAEGCWGIVGPKQAAMLVPALATDQATVLAPEFKIITATRVMNAYATVVEYALKNGWKTVGYDPYHTVEAHIVALRKISGAKLKWMPIVAATTPLRIKKDPEEVQALRRAGNVVARGFAHIKAMARPGMRECDLAAEFESFIKRNGATKTSFDSIVAFGENAAYPHYITGSQVLRKNDIVLCDIGALVDGYCSDLTRTFFLGSITPLGQKVYDTVARAQRLSIEAVKPGVKTAQIDRIARDEIERAGYGPRFIHSTGHGVGVEIHEAPGVGPASTETLEPGMIITVEPGIYLQGWGGVRIEDTLLVTDKGCEILTKEEELTP